MFLATLVPHINPGIPKMRVVLRVLGILYGVMLILPSLIFIQACTLGLMFSLLTLVMLPVMVVVSFLLGLALVVQYQACYEFLTNRTQKFKTRDIAGYVIGFIFGTLPYAYEYMLTHRPEYEYTGYEYSGSSGLSLHWPLLLILPSVLIPLTKYLALRQQTQ